MNVIELTNEEYIAVMESREETIKRDESKIKSFVNSHLKKYYNDSEWKNKINCPSIKKFDYTDNPRIFLNYSFKDKSLSQEDKEDIMLNFEDEFIGDHLRYFIDDSELNKYRFKCEGYPGIYVYCNG